MKKVSVKMFGVFRKYIPAGEISLQISDDSTAMDVKSKLSEYLKRNCVAFNENELIFESVLASSSEILPDTDRIKDDVLAILPPVCGG